MKKKKKDKQYLLKMSSDLSLLIDEAFSQYLKDTGKYISKAQYIRDILEDRCKKTDK